MTEMNQEQFNGKLRYACRYGDLQTAKAMIDQGADIDGEDFYGQTALHGAAQWGNLTIIQYLAEKGAQLDKRSNKGWTPLEEAKKFNHLKVVEYLEGLLKQKEDKEDVIK